MPRKPTLFAGAAASLVLAPPLPACCASGATPAVDVLLGRMLESLLPVDNPSRAALENTTQAYLAALRPDGSWADIEYYPPPGEDTRSVWPPLTHVERVQAMATCACTPGTWCAGDPALTRAARLAFDFWLLANLTNPDNWYQNMISNPISVGQTCVLLQNATRGTVPANVSAAVQVVVRRADWTILPPGMSNVTGANLVWMATAHVYGGLASGNESAITEATQRMWAELYVTTNQSAGLKEDHSFFQHCDPMGPTHVYLGPFGMIYDGGYGAGLTQCVVDHRAGCKFLKAREYAYTERGGGAGAVLCADTVPWQTARVCPNE